MRGEPIDGAITHYYESLHSEEPDNDKLKPDKFMEELARGAAAGAQEIDRQIQAKSDHWRLERMPVVDRNILRLAVFELSQQKLAPAIIIDEALDLARQFSGPESVPFINGVLEAVHRQTLAAGGVSS